MKGSFLNDKMRLFFEKGRAWWVRVFLFVIFINFNSRFQVLDFILFIHFIWSLNSYAQKRNKLIESLLVNITIFCNY